MCSLSAEVPAPVGNCSLGYKSPSMLWKLSVVVSSYFRVTGKSGISGYDQSLSILIRLIRVSRSGLWKNSNGIKLSFELFFYVPGLWGSNDQRVDHCDDRHDEHRENQPLVPPASSPAPAENEPAVEKFFIVTTLTDLDLPASLYFRSEY